MTGDDWATDPGTLELIAHQAIIARDFKGVEAALMLMAAVDAPRAAHLRDLMLLAIDVGMAADDDA